MSDINEMLEKSYKTLNELQLKLGELNEVHDDILSLKDAALKGNDFSITIPREFEKKFDEVKALSNRYLTDINAATNKYFEINNKVYLDNQNLFVGNIKDLQNKNAELQGAIDALKNQIERLEKIDLEKHFDKLQKTLSDIFGAINAINLTFTNTVQTLTNIVQSLGTIQREIDDNHKENKKLLNNISLAIGNHLAEQDKQTASNIKILESKLNDLSAKNELLHDEVKLSKTLNIVFSVVVILGLIIVTVLNSKK